jgi:hypothetical protein
MLININISKLNGSLDLSKLILFVHLKQVAEE